MMLVRLEPIFYVWCLSCFLVCSFQPCGHLLGKGDLLALLHVMLCFCGVLGKVW